MKVTALETYRLSAPLIADGVMAVPDAPALGLQLRQETLEKYGAKLS